MHQLSAWLSRSWKRDLSIYSATHKLWNASPSTLYLQIPWYLIARIKALANIIVSSSAHWGRNKVAAVSKTVFWYTLSGMKMYAFLLRFYWSLFLSLEITIFEQWFRYLLGADQATNHYLDQWWLHYRRCIYASLGLNELIAEVNRFNNNGFAATRKCKHD